MVKNRIEKVKLLGLATSHRLAAVLGEFKNSLACGQEFREGKPPLCRQFATGGLKNRTA
jgi:hypothetical protein